MTGTGWKGLPLNGLRAFEAAARHESFARAAAEIGVTPAAISQHVKALEQKTGLELFNRLPQGLTLTEEARQLLPAIQDSFGRIGSALEAANLRKVDEAVTINATGVFARGWLLPKLQAFRAAHPGVRVKVTTHNNRGVSANGAHLVIRFGSGRWGNIESMRLVRTEVTPLCGREVAGALTKVEDVTTFPLLDTAACDDCDFKPWDAWFSAAGIFRAPVIAAEFDSSALSVAAAIDGHGVAIAAPALFATELRSGRLHQPFDLTIEHQSTFYLMRRSDQSMTDAAETVWDWLASVRDVK